MLWRLFIMGRWKHTTVDPPEQKPYGEGEMRKKSITVTYTHIIYHGYSTKHEVETGYAPKGRLPWGTLFYDDETPLLFLQPFLLPLDALNDLIILCQMYKEVHLCIMMVIGDIHISRINTIWIWYLMTLWWFTMIKYYKG